MHWCSAREPLLFIFFSTGFHCIETQSCHISRPAAHERRHFRSRLMHDRERWRNEKEHQRLWVQREVQRLSDVMTLRLESLNRVHSGGISHEGTYTSTHTHRWCRVSLLKPVPLLLLWQIMNTSIWSWIRSYPNTAPKNGREKPARWEMMFWIIDFQSKV